MSFFNVSDDDKIRIDKKKMIATATTTEKKILAGSRKGNMETKKKIQSMMMF